jgi:hypothetical protein
MAQGSNDMGFAVNKTGRLAYKKTGDGDWEPVSPAEVPRDGLARMGTSGSGAGGSRCTGWRGGRG